MVSRRGDAVYTSRRCELRHLVARAECMITRRQIDVSVDRGGFRHPRLQQFSTRLVAGSRVGETELMAFLQRFYKDLHAPLTTVRKPEKPTVLQRPRRDKSRCLDGMRSLRVLGGSKDNGLLLLRTLADFYLIPLITIFFRPVTQKKTTRMLPLPDRDAGSLWTAFSSTVEINGT
nr:unnamed protein product [Spirometra erinaceieuropaei]